MSKKVSKVVWQLKGRHGSDPKDKLSSHCLYRFLDGKKIATSNSTFEAFKGFIQG